MSLASRFSDLALRSDYAERIRARPGLALAAAAAAIGLVPALRYAAASYAGYLALGKGGMPYNVYGWLLQASLQVLGRWDLTTPAPYRDAAVIARFAPHGRESFLAAPLPERVGAAPEVPGYIAPQRQTSDAAAEEVQARMRAYLDAVVAAHPAVFAMKPSGLEGVGTPAIWLRGPAEGGAAELPSFLQKIKGETVHVHPEGSTHVTLSLADAEDVVVKGWGQRHKLSGVAGYIPWSYVLVYAPRNDEEYEVWQSLVRAGCAFVAGGREIKV